MATRSVLAYPAFPSRRAPFGLRQAWTLVCAMAEARRGRRILAEMDAHQLADIGASRGDAMMEAGRAFWDVTTRR